MVMCCERRLENDEPADCVCGCGEKTSRFFKSSHDAPFYSNLNGLANGTKVLDIKRVLWCSLPLCCNNGEFADLIKEYREKTGCTDTSQIVPKWNVPCRYA